MEAMHKKLEPTEAISEQRLVVLQQRIEALHQAKLLGDDELYLLEDMVADFLEFKSSVVGVLTPQTIRANENASKLLV